MAADGSIEKRAPNLEVAFGFVGVLLLTAVGALVVLRGRIAYPLTEPHLIAAFAFSCALPFLASWRQAIRDGRLPVLPHGEPKHKHITGWGVLTLVFIVGVIVGVAAWAGPGREAGRDIQASWGVIVVAGVALFFVIAALAPNAPEMPSSVRAVGRLLVRLVWPFGRVLSVLDSMMVFAVAGAAGATRHHTAVRYFLLLATILPCGVLGYWLESPWGLIPIAWGFFVAISISRRWAWVEDDRELSMLNRKYTGGHLRVGFAQDLRDEALLSFMSMFVLVPLALRQAQFWTESLGYPLFTLDRDVGLLDWIGFYGTELAKAVPFVDWAEVYNVGGVAPIEVTSEPARHVVFATRVLVDLVFLAALVQAIGISTRNAKQKELFFVVGALDRLDPFIEQKEFRKLIRRSSDGEWNLSEAAIAAFPKYDALRLAELSAPEHYPISIAAKELRRQQHSDDTSRFHEQLIERAYAKKKDPDAIDEALTAIRMTGAPVQVEDLDRARIALNGRPSTNGVRETIMRLIVQAQGSPERTAAIRSALLGESALPDAGAIESVRDRVAPVRKIALEALESAALAGDGDSIAAVDKVADTDPSGNIKARARELLARIRGGALR